MDAGTLFELKKIREEIHDTNITLKRIAKVLEQRAAKEAVKETVCEGKKE